MQPSSHLLLTAVSAPGDMEMPLTGSSGHRDFPSLLAITPQLSAAHLFPHCRGYIIHWCLGAVSSLAVNTGHSQTSALSLRTEGSWYWLPSPLCAVFQRGALCRDTCCCFSTNHLLPVSAACICITSPLRHAPSSSRALYIVTGNCVFAMAARGALVIGCARFLLPQGMESWWVV